MCKQVSLTTLTTTSSTPHLLTILRSSPYSFLPTHAVCCPFEPQSLRLPAYPKSACAEFRLNM